MGGANMPDPDGVRKHGDEFRKAGEQIGEARKVFQNLRMNSSTLGEDWQDQGAHIAESLVSKVPTPWQRTEIFHNDFGNSLHDTANTYQGVDEAQADSLSNTDISGSKP